YFLPFIIVILLLFYSNNEYKLVHSFVVLHQARGLYFSKSMAMAAESGSRRILCAVCKSSSNFLIFCSSLLFSCFMPNSVRILSLFPCLLAHSKADAKADIIPLCSSYVALRVFCLDSIRVLPSGGISFVGVIFSCT